MRNRLIHAHFDVDRAVARSTVTRDLPALDNALSQLDS